MQTPALFQPMNLGAGFDGLGEGESDFFDTGTYVYTPSPYDTPVYADVPNVAVVNSAGDVNDQNGNPVISAGAIDEITRRAMTSGADVGQAAAQELQRVAPNWTSQFKDADSLVKAAYTLFNTSKAVITGKPIPQTITSPYVYNPANPGAYNPNVYRPTTATSQLSMSSTNMLLIGGAALAAFLVLRKK